MNGAIFGEDRADGDAPIVRRMLGFLRLLRANGFAIGIAEARDAVRALREIDLSTRHETRWALRSLLCASPSNWRRFQDLFDAYWFGRGSKRAVRSTGGSARANQSAATTHMPPGSQSWVPEESAGSAGGAASDAEQGRRAGASDREALSSTDLRHINDPEAMKLVHELAERLAARMRYRISRRRRQHRRGQLDLRETIHRSIRFGGTPVELKHRRRHPRPVRLILLLDASGSMNLYSAVFVRFIRGVLGNFRQAEAFVFHTRLAHISAALKERKLNRAIERMAIMASGWSGGTRIGECLKRFNDNYAADLINSRSIVIIMSDGYDTGAPALLGAEMARLKRRARRVVWLNPLMGWEDYQPVAGGMAAALPHVDLFAPAHNLESLAALEPMLVRL